MPDNALAKAWETNRRLKARNRRLKRNFEILKSEMRQFEDHVKSLKAQKTALRKLLVNEAYREHKMKNESRLIRSRMSAGDLKKVLIERWRQVVMN